MRRAFNGIIQRKLAHLTTQISRLQSHLAGVDRARFVEDWALRSVAERALQVATEIMIDVAERIIALKGLGPVASSAEAIQRLVDLGVIPAADPYVPIVRFRNLIVHLYDEIDPATVFELATERLGDFLAFRDAVDRAAAQNAPDDDAAPGESQPLA